MNIKDTVVVSEDTKNSFIKLVELKFVSDNRQYEKEKKILNNKLLKKINK